MPTPLFDHEKLILLAIVSLLAGLIAHFSGQVEEDAANYKTESLADENEND
jgi:hypothetical protein